MSHYNDFSNSNSNPRDNTTPKRKLSFNRRVTDLNGSITSIQYSASKTTSSNENSPFIKRKRMPKVESCRSFDLESPQYLNQGLESLKLATNEHSAKNSPMRSTKRSNKLIRHRSGPLTQLNLNKYLNNAQNNNLDDERIGEEEKPLTTKSSEKEENIKDEFDSESESKIDDLEDLLFGDRAARKNEESSNAEHHEIIKHSLEIDATCSNMIGDRSKAHVLPVIPSAKHTDLHCISPETLVDVLNGNFNDQIDEYIIVDSRYPYEYEGGHIHNAMNIFTKDRLFEEMFIKRLRFKCPPSSTNASRSLTTYASTNRLSDFMSEFRKSSRQETSQKRVIIIFHCEFSSERGPGLLRFLRSQDRALNEDCYPYLHYPELYLLEGGYKSFYEHFKNYCDPQMYKPMLHAEHLKDLKHFRAKAKSWEVSRHHIINKFSEKQHGLRKQIRSNLSRVQFNNNDNNNNS